jgi:hypothetical protein
MLGWHQVVEEMAAVYRRLPSDQRASAVFLTRDYSEASALSYWRQEENLPPAISGHNSEWWWGWAPATRARTVIAVGLPSSDLGRYFASVTRASTLQATHGTIDTEQVGLPIWICRDQLVPWTVIWPQLRLYA